MKIIQPFFIFALVLFLVPLLVSAQTVDYANCDAAGDLNRDEVVNIEDTALVARHIFLDLTFDGRCRAAADMNRNGEVTFADVLDTSLYGPVVIPQTFTCDSILGDIDSDCVVDYLDALAAIRISAGLAQVQTPDIASCDIRTDGQITVLDSLLIAQVSEGLLPQIPRTCNAYPACSDTQDNDADGLVDLEDPGCTSASDDDETNPVLVPACRDGIDNDQDGFIDLFDTGCSNPQDNDESDGPVQGTTQCSDLVDNDNDHTIDYPNDSGCENAADNTEGNGGTTMTQCNDGLDNDADGLVDYPADPGCENREDNNEHDSGLLCDDGIDNDLDGLVDLEDPDCHGNPRGPGEGEAPACSDGVDNDADGLIDYPADPDCTGPTDTGEGSLGDPRPEPISDPDARIFVSHLQLSEPYSFIPGNQLFTTLTFRNVGEVTLHHVKARVSIPALGVLRSVGPFTLGRGKKSTQRITLDVPQQVVPGIYDVRITLFADEEGAQRTLHRTLEISSLETTKSEEPLIHYVTTVYCPPGYSSCRAVLEPEANL